jgi:monoamine oxidase
VIVTAFTMTRWHQDEHSLGGYSCIRVGQKQKEWSKLLMKPIGGKIWLVGEHLHPTMYGCVHGAFETGYWAAEEVFCKISTQKWFFQL